MRNLIIFVLLSIGLSFIGSVSAKDQSKLLDINSFTIINENYIEKTERGAKILFNNQGKLPNSPTLIKGDNLELETWQPNYNISFGEPSFYIDLKGYYVITDISYYDTYASSISKVYQGEPFNWSEIGTLNLNGYKAYKILKNKTAIPTRYIRVTSNMLQTGIAELGLYGYKVRDLTKTEIMKTGPKTNQSIKTNLTAGGKIGTNAFVDDPYTALASVLNIRQYYSWNWIVTDNKKFAFNNVVNHDNYYKTLKEMGIDVIPAIQYTDESLRKNSKIDFNDERNYKPIEIGADPKNPLSYELHSKFMYNFAARYGSNKNVDKKTLNVAENTEVLVGLNYLNTVESWNEPNKTWEGVNGYFTPEEYAAMLSSDWDGHEGKIINGGVKKADKNFKLALGGLWWQNSSENVINYLDRMKTWFDYNRKDGIFCADIINIHIGFGSNPETGEWINNVKLIQDWISKNTPNTELWISEFDVDVKEYEKNGIDNHENQEYELARAQKLLRSYLLADQQGVDRLSMFMIRDTSYGQYYNSGLTTQKGEWDKKQSWYFLSSASDTLKNADLVSYTVKDNVYIYKYKDRKSSEEIYAVWTTSKNTDVEINVGNKEKATVVIPTYGIMEGNKEPLKINNSKVKINASQTVKFIKVSNKDVAYDNFPQQLIKVQEMRLGKLNGSPLTLTFDNNQIIKFNNTNEKINDNFMLQQFYNLFDEQNSTNTPATPWLIVKNKNNPTTEMGALAVHKYRSYPYDAIITFDDYYDITYIGLFDTYSVGKMDIIDDNTGEIIYTTNLDSYNYWRLVPMTKKVSTNKIRIIKYNDAKINELSFYGYKTNSKVGNIKNSIKGEIGKEEINAEKKIDIKSVDLGQVSNSFKGQSNNILRSFNFMFDEQQKTPYLSNEGVKQNTSWSTSFTNIWGNGLKFPYDGIVNFKDSQKVNKVGLWLGWGENQGKIDIYNNETNELLLSETVTGKNTWIVLNLSKEVKTKQLKIIKYDTKPIYEISFYGSNL